MEPLENVPDLIVLQDPCTFCCSWTTAPRRTGEATPLTLTVLPTGAADGQDSVTRGATVTAAVAELSGPLVRPHGPLSVLLPVGLHLVLGLAWWSYLARSRRVQATFVV